MRCLRGEISGPLSAAFWLVRILILLIMLSWASQSSWAENLEWLGDVGAAKERAKQENKFIMLYFTGSDWCPWCMRLKREVFDQPEFANFAGSKLVLVEVDFPHNKPMAHLQMVGNKALKKVYNVTGYPTVVVLNQEGREIHRLGYVSGGPAAFVAQVGIGRNPVQTLRGPPPPSEPEPPRKPVVFTPIPPATPIHYGALALKAISGPKDRRMVLINNASLMTGESAKVSVENRTVVVCCKEIRDDSVLITCDGEPRELKLGKR
jgi:protein disulfide-isomerase